MIKNYVIFLRNRMIVIVIIKTLRAIKKKEKKRNTMTRNKSGRDDDGIEVLSD